MLVVQIATLVLALLCRAQARGYGPGVSARPSMLGAVGGFPSASGGMPGIGSFGISGRPGVGAPVVAGGLGVGSGLLGVTPGRIGAGNFLPGGYPSGGSPVDVSPKPFNYGYEAPDGQGGSQFKAEEGDGSGSVRGVYGYTDAQGLYRLVQYTADQYGFTASVDTNEPGVDGKENPANVQMIVGQTPAGIQEQYTAPSAYGPSGAVAGGIYGGQVSGALGGRPGAYPGATLGGRPGFGAAISGGQPGVYGGAVPRGPGGYSGAVGGSSGGRFGQTGGFLGSTGSRYSGFGQTGSYGGISGLTGVAGGLGVSGATGGSYGMFSGIPLSTSGKSIY